MTGGADTRCATPRHGANNWLQCITFAYFCLLGAWHVVLGCLLPFRGDVAWDGDGRALRVFALVLWPLLLLTSCGWVWVRIGSALRRAAAVCSRPVGRLSNRLQVGSFGFLLLLGVSLVVYGYLLTAWIARKTYLDDEFFGVFFAAAPIGALPVVAGTLIVVLAYRMREDGDRHPCR